jgi:copper homeostasis protein
LSSRVEICVADAAGAQVAEQAGAHRAELCAGLSEGGVTPSIGTVAAALGAVSRIGVQVLIRPRSGDFVYSAAETDVMLADIRAIRELARGSRVTVGFAVGALTDGGDIDRRIMLDLLAACESAPVTFHRAFDLARDLDEALDTLIELGVGRVLTSGGAGRAVEGVDALARLVRRAAGRIAVMAAGAVRPVNVAQIIAATGVPDVHLQASRVEPSAMTYERRPGVQLASAAPVPEDTHLVTDAGLVRDVVRLAAR